MKCSGSIVIKCDSCNLNQTIPCNYLDHDWQEVSFDEGPGGKEIQYESNLEHLCTNCGNKIEIMASVWAAANVPNEMPDSFNIDSVNGGELVSHTCKVSRL